jgi:hypothetical protein
VVKASTKWITDTKFEGDASHSIPLDSSSHTGNTDAKKLYAMMSSASVFPVSVNVGASAGFAATHLPANSATSKRTRPIALASSTRCGRIQRM